MSPTFFLDQRMKNLTTELTTHVLGWADSHIITKHKETPSAPSAGPCTHRDSDASLCAYRITETVLSEPASQKDRGENVRLCVMGQQGVSTVSRLNSKPAHKISSPSCDTSSNPFLLHMGRSCDFRRDFTDD